MNKQSKYQKQNYDIYPIKTLGAIFATVVSGIAYYQFAENKSLYSNIILFLTLLVIVCGYFLAKTFLRLKNLLKEHNELVDEYEHTKDNRDTLIKITEDKNAEIEQLEDARSTMRAQAQMLIYFAYQDNKPEKEIVMKSLNIEHKEVDKNE